MKRLLTVFMDLTIVVAFGGIIFLASQAAPELVRYRTMFGTTMPIESAQVEVQSVSIDCTLESRNPSTECVDLESIR